MSRHYAVWIDHNEARIFHVAEEGAVEKTVRAPDTHHPHHPKRPDHHKGSPADAEHFYHDVVRSLEGADEVLVMGPGTAKLEFIRHAHKHDRILEPKIVGVETVDHPTDPQVVAFANRYFKKADMFR